MKLSYRGINYNHNTPVIATATKSGGKYRGLGFKLHSPQMVKTAHSKNKMTYRGISY